MYGDFLVPNNTNVNDSITTNTGAKWELFFEETRDEDGAIGYEWDKDFDDLPLHLNGVLFIVEQTGVSTNASITLNINGTTTDKRAISMTNTTVSSTTTVKTWVGSQIKNGIVEAFGKTRNTYGGAGQLFTGINFIEADTINYISLGISSLPVNANIKVYVLRGV